MTDEATPVDEGRGPSEGPSGGGETASGRGTAARGRRTRRGGRGRGRSSTAKKPQAGDAPSGQPEIDLDAQPGEVSRLPAKEASEAPATPAKRRRRRGGRGRGTKEPSAIPTAGEEEPPQEEAVDQSVGTERAEGATPATSAKRRRRRGGRGRGKKTPAETAAEVKQPTSAPDAEGVAPTPRTRRTPAKARTAKAKAPAKGKGQEKQATGTPKTTKVAAEPAAEESAPQPTSTRLRRQRQSRQIRRRRDVAVLVERVTDKLMVITEHGERDQIAVLEGRELTQHYVTRAGARSMVGNVYLGRVQNVLPGMEAAFVDLGRGRNAVLYAGEVNWSPEDLDGAPPRIEKVLKSGQSVLVQVTKDPIGGKGARLTAQLSLPGRYLVLAPNSNVTGISRRLPDDERRRLKTIHKKIKPDHHGLIVRTAAEGASAEALEVDLRRLVEEWTVIEKKAKRSKAPAVLYEEPELTVRVVRDLFTDEEYRELVTDSSRVYEQVTDYLRDVAPDLLAKVRLHRGKLPAFEEFHIVEQIHKGLDRKVWLPSGGYIVIDRTEALTVIDVNTGKAVGKTNLEETVVNTNVEAAREIARQLRLRDIGGMIVIDFIDMLLEQNKGKVIDAMNEALAHDKSRAQVFDISPLGLLEVTRKRVSGGLLDSFSETCPTCEGRGLLLTYDVN